MADQLREVEAIADEPRAAATFDNTVDALERSGQILKRTVTRLSSASPPPTRPTASGRSRTRSSPELAKHGDAIHLNRAL